MTAPTPTPDAAAVSAAVSLVSAMDQSAPATGRARRVLVRRARELGCQHVIPVPWLRILRQPPQPPQPRSAAQPQPEPEPLHPQPLSPDPSPAALLAAYIRGVREHAMISPHCRPPIPRDAFAQARVNSLLRLSQGDPTARSDDADLLAPHRGPGALR